MSYILDALKKAEAERNDGVASVARFPQIAASALPAHSSARRKPWPWLALTALAGIAGIVVWLRFAPAAAPAPYSTAENKPALPVTAASMPRDKAVREADANMDEYPDAEPAKARKARKAAVKKRPPAAEAIAMQRELPDSVQKQIPALKVGGYIYSTNRADRSVLVNNRLLREGEEIAPGLTLEKMMPHEMVLRFQGYHFRMSY